MTATVVLPPNLLPLFIVDINLISPESLEVNGLLYKSTHGDGILSY